MGWETTTNLSPATWILYHLHLPRSASTETLQGRMDRDVMYLSGGLCYILRGMVSGMKVPAKLYFGSMNHKPWNKDPIFKQPVLFFRGELLVFRGVLGRLLFSCGVVGGTCLFVPLSKHYYLRIYKKLSTVSFVKKRNQTTWGHSVSSSPQSTAILPLVVVQDVPLYIHTRPGCPTSHAISRASLKTPQFFVSDGQLEKPFRRNELKNTTLRWQFKQI